MSIITPQNQNQKSNQALRPADAKSAMAGREEAVLAFWKENDIFKKSLEKDAPNGEFVFYEGPPTANAKPALHHLEARAFKDVLPRYKTMQGFHVRRRAGWDTHGLPVELQIEKKLGFTHKKQIEEYGIAAFNKECKDSVFTFIKDWEDFTERMGYWVDKNDAYYTFDPSYMESLWNIFAKVDRDGLLYKDYKVVPWCPRCGTTLASHELAQGYQDDKDLSVIAKFTLTTHSIGLLRSSGRVDGAAQPDTHQSNTARMSLLAWTTTPWTLPGNVGLAVGKDVEYILIHQNNEFLVLAKNRLEIMNGGYEIISELKGSDLVGLEYEPLYPYLGELIKGHHQEKNMQNAYKVYAADFVTTTDGTGIVHTAVMYGAEDFELGTQVGLPKFHTVDAEGKFVQGTGFLEGRFVKDEEVAIDIIKDLAHRGLLFKKEKYEHSYPHCWRCKTPLIYYARDSWYIGMSQLRDKLMAENEQINWEPFHIKEGRFGEWLREVKDWAISRERYWGTPLPIWHNEHDGVHDRIVVDSIETLKKYTKKSGNEYFVMRHGQSEGNIRLVVSSQVTNKDPLTEEGRKQVYAASEQLSNIDMIVASPFMRTTETAKIMAEKYGIDPETIVYDERLGEINAGELEGKEWKLYHEFLYEHDRDEWYERAIPQGESLADVARRVGAVLYDIEKTYSKKKILIVTHGGPAWLLYVVAGQYQPNGKNYTVVDNHIVGKDFKYFDNAEIRPLPFVPLPHNENFELDLHRPYIDEVVLEKDGHDFHRVKEVMDVWFDSGSMPFAQDHYPFSNKELLYPADFISEAIDQTRGWFYTLHAVGTLMGRGRAFNNVICLGHLLDKEGKKMSKSIGNIVEPFAQIEKFGVDSVRLWMYSVNQPGESKNYDEKTVGELQRQVFGLLNNVIAFYELYRDTSIEHIVPTGEHVLDAWIATRLDQLISFVTEELNHYRVMQPVREMRAFIEDLSTWYLRRSRDRIKDGDTVAKATLYRVLKTLAQVMAPFAPFAAEDIWQKLRQEDDVESVHLSEWPKAMEISDELLTTMQIVRNICTEGNALRKKLGIAVKQPLGKFEVANIDLRGLNFNLLDKYLELIKEELNVKNVVAGSKTSLDTTLTSELKAEGNYRELVRAVQDMRKAAGLEPSDMVSIGLSSNALDLLNPFIDEFKKTVQASTVTFVENDGTEVKIDELNIHISIEK